MENYLKIPLLFIFFTLFYNSCAIIDYDQMNYHVPSESVLLGDLDKGEVQVSGAAIFSRIKNDFSNSQGVFKTNKRENYISLNGAYSFANHFAVQGNFFLDHQINALDNRLFIQQSLAIGGFFKRERERQVVSRIRKRKLIIEGYAGMAYGNINQDFTKNPGYGLLSINFYKAYVHGGMAYDWGRWTEVSFSTRYVHTNFISLNQINDIPTSDNFALGMIKENNSFNHLELSPKFSFGNEYASAYISFTSTVNINPENIAPPGRVETLFLGMEFNINKISEWRKNRKANKTDLGMLQF